MSSLRLALKQSLQETGHLFKDKKKKSSSTKNNSNSSGNKSPSNSGRNRRRSRQPGDPPRKRGRPRKHPLPSEDGPHSNHLKQSSSQDLAQSADSPDGTDRRHRHHSGSEGEGGSESENEFSYDSEEEEDDSEEEDEDEEHDDEENHRDESHHDNEEEEESGHPEEENVTADVAVQGPASPKGRGESSSSQIKKEEAESDEERRRQKKLFKKNRQQAANKIQEQWKKKAGISSPGAAVRSYEDEERQDESYEEEAVPPTKPRASSPVRNREISSNSNASTPTSGGDKVKKKKDGVFGGSSKSQTVPPPEIEVLEWNRGLSEKKCRKHVSAGLRVKVRFAAKVKRDGKVVKKKIWYGGRVSAVSKEGSKIRIKYDDGTSEISKFPDKDVVVDDTFNGKHLVTADRFVPPPATEYDHDDMEEEEHEKAEEGEILMEVDDKNDTEEKASNDKPEPSRSEKKEEPVEKAQLEIAPNLPPPEVSAPAEAETASPTPMDDTALSAEAGVDAVTDEKEFVASGGEAVPPASSSETKDAAAPNAEERTANPEPVVSIEAKQDAPVLESKPVKEAVSVAAPTNVSAPEPEQGEVTTPKPKSTGRIISSAVSSVEESRLPRDLGPPEEGELSPGLSLLSRSREMVKEVPMVPEAEKPNHIEFSEISHDKASLEGGTDTQSTDPVQSIPAKQQEDDFKPEAASGNPFAENPAPEPAEFQDLKPPAEDTAPEAVAALEEEKPADEGSPQASPSTPKPNLTIRISNSKSDQDSRNKAAPKTPKTTGSDSEEELFADTPVTERKVKSIQLKRKNKRKRDALETTTEDQPSEKRIHLKGSKSEDAEADLAIPEMNESITDKNAGVQGTVEALNALADPVQLEDEEVKKPNTTISISLKKPEAEDRELSALPKLKKKRDRAGSPGPRGRKSPVPRSRSPTPQLEVSASVELQEESEKKVTESSAGDDAAALSPRRGKTIAPIPGRAAKEGDESAPELPTVDESTAEDADARPLSRSKGSTESLPGMRFGRRAAQQAKEKMTPKPDDKTVEPGKKKKKRKRQEGEEDGEQSDESVDDRQWVQCDDCGKWRILPSSVKISSLPKNWYCHLNTYDPKRNDCSAPEQSAKQAAKEWRKARKRAKQLRLAELQAVDATKVHEDAQPEARKELVLPTSPKPPKGTKKERAESKRASPVGTEESLASNSGSDAPKADRKGKKGKQQHHEEPAAQAVVEQPTPSPAPDAEAPKKPGRKRGRPARNPTPQKGSEDHENVEWVQCEKCEKWRKLPPHISADELTDTWYCSMNTWNPDSASCSAAEDKADATHHEVGNYAGIFGAGAGKYSYRSMIFGNGKKHNRPMSERSRAAESLFMRQIDEVENPYPTVKYSKSSCFLPRTSNFTKANAVEEEKVPSIFDVLSNSELWAELHSVGQPMQVSSDSDAKSYPKFLSFENLPDDVKEAMREVVLHSLGEGTLTGEEVIQKVHQYPWETFSPDLASTRGYLNADIVINSLLALVRDGVVEMTSIRNFKLPIGQWVPKYRKVRSLRAMKIEESIKSSRCMKIAKPWKKSEWITGGAAFS